MAGWRRVIERLGVEVRENCELTGFVREGGKAVAAATAAGDIRAEAFVVATGAWTPLLNKQLGYKVPIVPGKGYSVTMPRPAVCLRTLGHADQRIRHAYLAEFPGFYKPADAGMVDEDGYLYVMARTDDIINVAGHRLSTGAMEEVLSAHPDVAEDLKMGLANVPVASLRTGCGEVVAKLSQQPHQQLPDRQTVGRRIT